MKLNKYIFAIVLVASSALAFSAKKKKKKGNKNEVPVYELKTQGDSLGYAIGLDIANSFSSQGLDTIANMKAVHTALDEASDTAKVKMNAEEARAFIQSFFQKLQQKSMEKEFGERQKEQAAFLEENKSNEGVTVTESGLQYKILTSGEGPKPGPQDNVRVHYHGTLIDGTVFDSSVQRGEPIEFPVGGVIPGWVEALQLMPVGSKWRLFIPYNLAYGERGAGQSIPPFSSLVFDVELLEIVSK